MTKELAYGIFHRLKKLDKEAPVLVKRDSETGDWEVQVGYRWACTHLNIPKLESPTAFIGSWGTIRLYKHGEFITLW
jgi:hypothetical protein